MLDLALNIIALVSLLQAAHYLLRSHAGRDATFWRSIAVAVLGPTIWSVWLLSGGWISSPSVVLWVSISGTMAMFSLLAFSSPQGWRLAPLLLPILSVVGLLASMTSWVEAPPVPLVGGATPWVILHIVISVLTYSLLGLAAIASLSIFLQERALKRKRPTALTRLLPSVADAERMSGRLLLDSEIVLGLGLVTGLALQYVETGTMLSAIYAEKILFSALSFVLIGMLLVGHRVCGVRGRLAARVVLVAYLLLTMAYPGIRFIQQVLLSPPVG